MTSAGNNIALSILAPIREGRRCRPLMRQLLQPLADGAPSDVAADALIDYFGSLRVALTASAAEQMRAVNDRRVVDYLGIITQSMRWALRSEVETRTFLADTCALRAYLRLSHGSAAVEDVRVFYLNSRGRLLREESAGRGSPDLVFVSVPAVIRRGLDLGARWLMVAHNHPSGDPTPSRDDKDLTRKIAVAAHTVEMTLYDHLIVAEGSDFSFREAGLL